LLAYLLRRSRCSKQSSEAWKWRLVWRQSKCSHPVRGFTTICKLAWRTINVFIYSNCLFFCCSDIVFNI
jgi:hypothetical protein